MAWTSAVIFFVLLASLTGPTVSLMPSDLVGKHVAVGDGDGDIGGGVRAAKCETLIIGPVWPDWGAFLSK